MSTEAINITLSQVKLSLINFFIFIGLLRLTNFNYYLSQFFGFKTTINHTGGDAFNFINYIAAGALVLVFSVKAYEIETKWRSMMPYLILIGIYVSNILLAPYGNRTWFFYQLLFIIIAGLLHIYTRRNTDSFSSRLVRGIDVFFWAMILFVVFCCIQILQQHTLGYYFAEFNDAFVHSLDDFGVMKQRYGYLLGFLMSYILFIKKSPLLKILLIFLIAFAGFGIRSFILGMIGATAVFTVRKPKYFVGFLLVAGLALYFLLAHYFDNIIYDTRFYSFYNAYDIMLKFPFGVGLGGYPSYTEAFSRNLFAQFYNINAILDFIPTAPESDLVHLFGSLGLGCGLIHLLIQLRLVWYSYSLQAFFNPFEKCILFYFCFMTFFGISEDSIFSVNYWIFFGITSGIISSVLWRKRQLNEV